MKSQMEREVEVISALLKKYERSKASNPQSTSKRRIYLDLVKGTDLPSYVCDDYMIVSAYNETMLALQHQGWVDVEWVKNSKDVLAKLLLNVASVNALYERIGKESKQARYLRINQTLCDYETNLHTPWMLTLFQEEKAYVQAHATTSIFPKDQAHLISLLDALAWIDQGKVAPMRVMSIQLYHDSKYFEKEVKHSLCSILRNYHPDIQNYLEVDQVEILEECGILAHQELYEFCGPLSVAYQGKQLDFSSYEQGACIKRNMALNFTDICFDKIQQVTFIENYTNYEVYLQTERSPQELVIYHGGYYSSRKAEFYLMLEEAMPKELPCRFWADIDYGGFSMFLKLQRIFLHLAPMRMDLDAYKCYLPYAREVFSDHYSTLLQTLRQREDAIQFHDVIDEILKQKKVVEQESFLIKQD